MSEADKQHETESQHPMLRGQQGCDGRLGNFCGVENVFLRCGRYGRHLQQMLQQGSLGWNKCFSNIDRFPQRTLEWLSLTVLADPFWGRLPWLLKRRGGKHSKHEKFSRYQGCERVPH
jgi:hypothetical protein